MCGIEIIQQVFRTMILWKQLNLNLPGTFPLSCFLFWQLSYGLGVCVLYVIKTLSMHCDKCSYEPYWVPSALSLVKMTDTRSSSALFKRAEQLKRWEESDTNKQSPMPKRASRIQFSSGIVFLAACTAGDKDEVQRLLKMGADINTANVDGLTALHQVSRYF